MIHMGNTMSTMRDVQYCGGNIITHVGDIVSAVGRVQCCRGTQITKENVPHSTERPHGTQGIPSQYLRCPHSIIYHGINSPTTLKISRTVFMMPPRY